MDRRGFLRNLAGIGAASAAVVGITTCWEDGADGSSLPIRPPGALPEADFLSTCIRCMRCIDACPNHAIKSTATEARHETAGTPYLNPREQSCMLCSRSAGDYLRCTEVCPSGALQPIRKELDEIRSKVRMGVAKIDLNLCYSYNNYTCGTCFHACPLQAEALKIGLWERPQIDEDACIGCGLCERACIRYPQAVRIEPVARPDLRRQAAVGSETPAAESHVADEEVR